MFRRFFKLTNICLYEQRKTRSLFKQFNLFVISFALLLFLFLNFLGSRFSIIIYICCRGIQRCVTSFWLFCQRVLKQILKLRHVSLLLHNWESSQYISVEENSLPRVVSPFTGPFVLSSSFRFFSFFFFFFSFFANFAWRTPACNSTEKSAIYWNFVYESSFYVLLY